MTQSDNAALAAVIHKANVDWTSLAYSASPFVQKKPLAAFIAKRVAEAGYRLPSSAALERQGLRAEVLEEAASIVLAQIVLSDAVGPAEMAACIAEQLRALAQQNPRESEVEATLDRIDAIVGEQREKLAEANKRLDEAGAVGLDAPAPSDWLSRETTQIALDGQAEEMQQAEIEARITTLTSELAETRAQRDALVKDGLEETDAAQKLTNLSKALLDDANAEIASLREKLGALVKAAEPFVEEANYSRDALPSNRFLCVGKQDTAFTYGDLRALAAASRAALEQKP